MKNRLLEEQNKKKYEKIITLCDAAAHNERQFWKLVKGKRHKSQFSTFLINDKFVSDTSEIRKIRTVVMMPISNCLSKISLRTKLKIFALLVVILLGSSTRLLPERKFT